MSGYQALSPAQQRVVDVLRAARGAFVPNNILSLRARIGLSSSTFAARRNTLKVTIFQARQRWPFLREAIEGHQGSGYRWAA